MDKAPGDQHDFHGLAEQENTSTPVNEDVEETGILPQPQTETGAVEVTPFAANTAAQTQPNESTQLRHTIGRPSSFSVQNKQQPVLQRFFSVPSATCMMLESGNHQEDSRSREPTTPLETIPTPQEPQAVDPPRRSSSDPGTTYELTLTNSQMINGKGIPLGSRRNIGRTGLQQQFIADVNGEIRNEETSADPMETDIQSNRLLAHSTFERPRIPKMARVPSPRLVESQEPHAVPVQESSELVITYERTLSNSHMKDGKDSAVQYVPAQVYQAMQQCAAMKLEGGVAELLSQTGAQPANGDRNGISLFLQRHLPRILSMSTLIECDMQCRHCHTCCGEKEFKCKNFDDEHKIYCAKDHRGDPCKMGDGKYKKTKLINKSHAYPEQVLLRFHKKRNANEGEELESESEARKVKLADSIWITFPHPGKSRSPTSCHWKFLCEDCETASNLLESKFTPVLNEPVKWYGAGLGPQEQMIHRWDVQLFNIFMYRGFFFNVDGAQYFHRLREHKYSIPHPVELIIDHALQFCLDPLQTKQAQRGPEDVIYPWNAKMLFHFRLNEPHEWLVEFPVICHVTSGGVRYVLIYCQMPPFYFAFLPNKHEARRLQPHFDKIIDATNQELLKQRHLYLIDQRSRHAREWKQKLKDNKREPILIVGYLRTMGKTHIEINLDMHSVY